MKATATETTPDQIAPDFCAGMQHFGEPWPGFDSHAAAPAVGADTGRIAQVDADAAYQTLLMADALRATKGVPGFHTAARVVLVEASPHLRQVQAATLSAYAPGWIDPLEDLPEGPLFLIANEFLDLSLIHI